ncbi:uncharacterized protein GIQ15_06278 [Arthroderma uncinatum]|uniref:uncharacterized protein n=1 Tax=Arthroderma uncinatum TaxID=74035 RepID=UPI00144AB81D|nr:uncharacterized protein GIQ15_06278 [Arthroderma uncinatum]KAF3480931.1 hypothetical protein GIQ15_06278 [Arthroderma uncinatum]
MPSYAVYRVTETGLPRNHHAIFVETEEDGPGSGCRFNVTGNVQNGMEYEERKTGKPQESASFMGMEKLGVVDPGSYSRLQSICRSTPVPKKQFDGPKRLYPDVPLRRCQEWTAETVKRLIDEQALEISVS